MRHPPLPRRRPLQSSQIMSPLATSFMPPQYKIIYLLHPHRHLPPPHPRRRFLRHNLAHTLRHQLHRPRPQHPHHPRLHFRPSSTFWLARVSFPKNTQKERAQRNISKE